MTPRKNSTEKKIKINKVLQSRVLLKCKPCSISFPSSVDLIHHVFNDHNFQPTIELDHVESVDEVLTKYINTTQNKKRNRIPAKPKEKKSPGRKRKSPTTPGVNDVTNKPKRAKKEKKIPAPLKAAFVDGDGYSIPKIKIGRFNTTNVFSLDYTPENKLPKDILLSNQLEPIVNSTSLVNSTVTSATSTSANSNGTTTSTPSIGETNGDDGLSTLMSEVYNVLDGQDSESSLNLPPTNGEPSAQEFLEMREIQGLYDDEMTYTHLASAFEIPQIKPGGSSISSQYLSESNSLMMSSSEVPTYMSPSYLDKSPSKMTPVDNLNNLSHNLESILNKPSGSCMMDNSSNPYLSNSSPSHSSMNNSLPNHNMTGSAFTSTSQKSGVSSSHVSGVSSSHVSGVSSSHNMSGSSYLLSGGTSSSGVPSPSSTMSPHKSAPSPALSPHIPSPAMSPHVNSPAMSPHSTTPSSPHPDTKKKSGLNIIPTEKLLDNSKPNQLINNQLVNNQLMNNQLVNNNPLISDQLAGHSPYYSDSSMSGGYSSYYNPMYSSYMGQMTSYSNQQYMSSSSSMSPYFSNNFYTPPSTQSIEDNQYKRMPPLTGHPNHMGPPLGSSLGHPSIPSGSIGPPSYKRPEDTEFKKPIEPANKQPKIVPKKLSSLLEKDGKKFSGPRYPTGPISIQRPSSLQSISRTPNSSVQLRGTRPPSAPSLRGPRGPPGPTPLGNAGPRLPTAGLSISPAKPNSVASSNDVESPATSALKKRGITISSVAKPAIRKLTSSVNITPVVKKPGTENRLGQLEIVPKMTHSGPSRPVELLKDAECNLGIPVVDLSNQSVLSNLNSMGITSFIPVNQMRGSNQIFALPIINTGQMPRRLDDLGASGVLNLGSVYKLK